LPISDLAGTLLSRRDDMRHAIPALVLLVALGCSGGTKSEGDADTGTDVEDDPAGEASTDPGTDPGEETAPDAVVDASDEPAVDPDEDTGTDPVTETTDPGTEPSPDPRPDPTIEPYPDPRPDPHTDPALDGACVDPCAVSTVSGCGADCGGFAGTPCPHSSLTCVYPTGVTAGICIPTSALGCSTDVDCACFPSFHICTSGTTWSCRSGSCGLSCV
jgi:hypothetical protein